MKDMDETNVILGVKVIRKKDISRTIYRETS